VSEAANAYWVIPCSLLGAAVLALVPLDQALAWWRPEWIALLLIYWVVALPQRVGLVTALITGLLVDVMEGAALGQNMLSLSVLVVLARLAYQRFRVFTLVQQACVVFFLIGIHQLITQWLQGLQGSAAPGFRFLLPALVSAVLWPVLMPGLRGLRRSLQVR
jgi:rod shape-determining protein MreD